MLPYLEIRNIKAKDLFEKMRSLRDKEIQSGGENSYLFTEVVTELSYRVAENPDFGEQKLCPKCETPIPKESYNHYCGFCGQFINK